MNEKISALIDAELDELDERRTLEAMKKDRALRGTWERYHLIRSAMTRQLDVLASADLADRVWNRIDSDSVDPSGSLRFWPLAGGFAAAASVALVAFLGLQAWRVPVAPVSPAAPVALAPSSSVTSGEPTVAVTAVSTDSATRRTDGRLHYYLFGHNEFVPAGAMGSMLPYVRVVSDNQEK